MGSMQSLARTKGVGGTGRRPRARRVVRRGGPRAGGQPISGDSGLRQPPLQLKDRVCWLLTLALRAPGRCASPPGGAAGVAHQVRHARRARAVLCLRADPSGRKLKPYKGPQWRPGAGKRGSGRRDRGGRWAGDLLLRIVAISTKLADNPQTPGSLCGCPHSPYFQII